MRVGQTNLLMLLALIFVSASCSNREVDQSKPISFNPPTSETVKTNTVVQVELSADEKEFARLSVLAAKGDAKSQTSLAHKYALGKGVEKDMNEAVR